MAELQKAWQTQAASPSGEEQSYGSQQTMGFSQYIGRPVLSKVFGYILKQWGQVAGEHGVEFNQVRPPLGVRYLSHYKLQEIKHHSHTSYPRGSDRQPNIHFTPVSAVGQILEQAFADRANFNSALATQNFSGFGTRLALRKYQSVDPEDMGSMMRVVMGIELSDTTSTDQGPPDTLLNERLYFIRHYDPLYKPDGPEHVDGSSVYVPMGMIDGLSHVSDEGFQEIAGACQELLPIKALLGHVQLLEETDIPLQ